MSGTVSSDRRPIRDELHQIGAVAERVGLSLRTIRHYEEVGLVTPTGRSAGGFRLYTDADVDRLSQVKVMKPLGFSLEETHEVLELLVARAGARVGGPAGPPRRAGGPGPGAVRRSCATVWSGPKSSTGALMSLIVKDLTVEIDTKRIVEGVSFDVRAGDKVGLVGRNGAGKTTLFRALGGAILPKSGTVRLPEATGYLSQDPRSDDVALDTVCLAHVLSGRGLDVAMDRIEKLTVALEEDASMENIEAFSAAHEHFESLGGWAAEADARRLAAGLGLADDRLDLHVGALSGGERRRLELTRILFAGSEVLLLDEPTNHLDADARDWLLEFLRSFRGALVVISHDLGLLDDAITKVLHLDREHEDAAGTLIEYRSNYTTYLTAREVEEERVGKLADRQAKEITRLARRADGMRGQSGKRAKVAKGLDARAARLEAEKVSGPERRRTISVRLPDPPESDRTVLDADALAKSYGELDVFDDVTFGIGRGERMLIMGLNGAGKTTLLKLLADRHRPGLGQGRAGSAHQHRLLRPGARRASSTATRCWSTCARRRRSATRRPAPSWACSGCRATRRSRMRRRCRAARRPSSHWRSWSSAGTTCCCWTSRPTTWIRCRAPRSERR